MTEDKQRHALISWSLIEWKLMYYYPEKIAPEFHEKLTVPDAIYDQMEQEYLLLCERLDLPNTLVHKVEGAGMVEVDFTKPSVKLVLSKYGIRSL